jgi:hypothetical protein
MDSRTPIKQWIKMFGCGLLGVTVGCSQAVLLIQETEKGGVVTYLFKEDLGGSMGSPYRKDALKRIEEKCPAGYIVLEEGEVQGYSSMSTVGGAEGQVSGRRWGIQFRCK